MFNAAAKDFAACVDVIDPESAADLLANRDTPNTLRQAWSDAAMHAARLDHLTEMLATAAELAHFTVRFQPFDGGTLALVCDAKDSDRTELFKAWQNKSGRTTVWGPLLKAGAHIRAANLDSFTPYPSPDPEMLPVAEFEPRESFGVVIA